MVEKTSIFSIRFGGILKFLDVIIAGSLVGQKERRNLCGYFMEGIENYWRG